MKAFLSIKYHSDHRNKNRIQAVSSALKQNGIDSVCIARDVEKWGALTFKPDELMQRTFQEIDTCDWFVIDLTEKGVGVGIEAGYAHANKIPIITIAAKGADISETLRGISRHVFAYDDFNALTRFFESASVIMRRQ
jgi:nucleoside 2-deoxyribosyltransferase